MTWIIDKGLLDICGKLKKPLSYKEKGFKTPLSS
jgi:hypothetical protein